jgi:isopenicillin N synthase-like dioxygenase
MIKNSHNTLLRLLYYPPLTGNEPQGAIRAAEHEDINMLTLLPSATAAGLQVKDVKGGWHDVPCDPGTIVVNVGDMLQRCSQHYYPSTTHRVINPEGEFARQPRLSMPLFLHARPEVKISPTQTAQEYLDERLRELGLK